MFKKRRLRKKINLRRRVSNRKLMRYRRTKASQRKTAGRNKRLRRAKVKSKKLRSHSQIQNTDATFDLLQNADDKIVYIDAESTVVNTEAEESNTRVTTHALSVIGASEPVVDVKRVVSRKKGMRISKTPEKRRARLRQNREFNGKTGIQIFNKLHYPAALTPRTFLLKRSVPLETKKKLVEKAKNQEADAYAGYLISTEIADATTSFFPALIS